MTSASASNLISRIGPVLDDLQFVANAVGTKFNTSIKFSLFMLRNYEVFLVSVAKVSNGPIVGPFLQELQDLVCELERFNNMRLFLSGVADLEDSYYEDMDVEGHLDSLGEQSGQLYDTLLDPSSRQSNTLTVVEIADMIASVMNNLSLFHSLEWDHNVAILEELIKALGEQILFLDNLRLFASSNSNTAAAHSHAADQHFLAHVEAVCIKTAYLLIKCQSENVKVSWSFSEDLLLEISKLIKYIKPIDHQVHLTYTEILRRSKLRRRLLAPADRDLDREFDHAKGFLNSLRYNLLELLQMDTQGVVSFTDTLQELYEGLGSLPIVLSHQPRSFDSAFKDHISDVVSDAGILICSLYQTHLQLDHDLQDLLEAIRLVLAEFGEKAASEPMLSKVPSTAPLSFVDFLLEKLTELTSCEVETNIKSRARVIEEELVTLRSFLKNIVELREEQEEFQTLRDHILELVYKAEHLIDYLIFSDLSDSFSLSFDSFMKDIKNIHSEFDVQKLQIKMKELTMNLHHKVPFERTLVFENEVVGYIEEAESIKDQLTRGSKQLCIVAIVGMPGQGKTTLAAKIYNDPSVSFHFSARAQTIVSQTVDKSRVLLDLLGQIDPNKCSGIISDYDLVQKVWRSLKGRTYLIFLDDVWDAEAWSSLKEAFPDDYTGSRIMLTSRHHDVVPNHEPFELRPFSEEESIDLLQRKLFSGSGWPIDLVDIARRIAHICKGLPLTILIVAGILSTIEREGWEKILGGLGSCIVSSTEQCKNTLELSYSHLPEHLRPCFLYLATFAEDEEVSVRRLLRLWIAEGFVRKDRKKSVEDVAEDYLKYLIGRSLLMVAKQRSIGGVKSCRIHDLLHEFCLQKARDEQFFSFLGGNNEVLEFHARYLRRLCINFDPKHLIRSNKFLPYVRSLNFNYCVQQILPNFAFMFHLCKLLRVLDLEKINLGSVFPSEIGLLVQLAFLAIRGSMTDIPESIGNLSSLECLILNQSRKGKMLTLPASVWKLKKLRHLHMTSQGGIFPMENHYNSSDLFELDWLSGVAIDYPCNMEGLLKKFPNIRKLRCTLSISTNILINHVRIVVPDILSQLESVSMSLSEACAVTHSKFSFPTNLKKLTLSDFPLSSRSLKTISKLHKLEVLKFIDVSFEGNAWEMEEEEFSKLKFLQLSSWDLISWSASDDQFEYLEKLVLVRCGCLIKMPDCLEYSSTLSKIEVRYCSNSVHDLVRNIKDAQENNGNSELKIINVKSA